METSILTNVKKVLGIAESYTVFDEDVLMHINATFSVLQQLGIGPLEGFMVEDKGTEWEEFDVPAVQLNLVKTYVFLKVRILFDPPTTSYLIDAATRQIDQFEWRLNVMRENEIPYPLVEVVPDEEVIVI